MLKIIDYKAELLEIRVRSPKKVTIRHLRTLCVPITRRSSSRCTLYTAVPSWVCLATAHWTLSGNAVYPDSQHL